MGCWVCRPTEAGRDQNQTVDIAALHQTTPGWFRADLRSRVSINNASLAFSWWCFLGVLYTLSTVKRCLFTRLRKCCIVRPMYCFPHAQSSKYITYCVSHLKWDLMLNSSLVCVDLNFLSCANLLQHLRLFFSTSDGFLSFLLSYDVILCGWVLLSS